MKQIIVLPLFFLSISCFADVYSGSFQLNDKISIFLKYVFDASNKNNLKGTVEGIRRGPVMHPCWQGTRSIDGSKIDGQLVTLIANPNDSQASLNCYTYEFVGKEDGNKFIGKFTFGPNTNDVVLTKE